MERGWEESQSRVGRGSLLLRGPERTGHPSEGALAGGYLLTMCRENCVK